MNPKPHRIALWIVIFTAITIGVLNLVEVRSRIHRLQSDFQQQLELRQQAESHLAGANRSLKSVSQKLHQTEQSLQTVTLEKQNAVAEASVQSRRAAKAELDLAESGKQLMQTSDHLAQYVYSGLRPGEVIALADRFKKLQAELAKQQHLNQKLNTQIAEWKELHPDLAEVVLLPRDLRGQVLAFDPKWRFIVVNVGQEQGLRPRGQLLVSRNGKLVGRAIITRVDKDRAIANLFCESPEVFEGDAILPADPRS